MSRPTPRRSVSSRGVTPRPRRIAGRDAVVREDRPDDLGPDLDPDLDPDLEPDLDPDLARDLRPGSEPDLEPDAGEGEAAEAAEAGEPEAPGRPGPLARPRTTRILTIVLAVIALVLAAQAVWFFNHRDSGESERAASGDGPGSVSVPQGRPVVAAELFAVEGVDAAAKAAQEIVAVDFNKYDDEVEAAAKLMTGRFEEQYRTTAGDIKDDFVANKTVVQANVVAQGVVRANRTRLQALVFLNQVVTRSREGKPETVVTPYKVLVTMVHTDEGWLVDGLDTDEPQDKNN